MTAQQLLDKWQALDINERERVLEFIESIERQKQQKKTTSSLGKKLRKIRQEIIDSGVPLLTAEEVEIEKAERRGGYLRGSL